jgi:Clostripain family
VSGLNGQESETLANENSAQSAPGGPESRWTIMIFMGADTIAGNTPLDGAADADLDEIGFAGGTDRLNIFVQLHRTNRVARRFHFGANNGKPFVDEKDIPEAVPGDALIPFVRDCLQAVVPRKNDGLMLVLWGHAYDFAFGRSRTRSGVIDSIDFVELSDKLEDFQASMSQASAGNPDAHHDKLDIVGFDTCDAATLELAYQLEPYTRFMVGSQVGIPIPGWPYDRILDRLVCPKGDLMSPSEFGSYIVRRYCESYPPEDPVSLSLLNLAKLADVRHHTKLLALALATTIGRPQGRNRIIDLFKRSQTAKGRPFVDVADLCVNLVRDSGHPFVTAAARALGNQLIGPWPPMAGESQDGSKRPLVAEIGRNAGELARLNGISLYAPHVAPENDGDEVRKVYNSFRLAQETRWSRLVHALADVS